MEEQIPSDLIVDQRQQSDNQKLSDSTTIVVEANPLPSLFSFTREPSNPLTETNSISLIELSVSLKSKLDDLKSIKQNLFKSRRFSRLDDASEMKENNGVNYETIYRECKLRLDDIETGHQREVKHIFNQMKESRDNQDKYFKTLNDELAAREIIIDEQRNTIGVLMEKIASLESELRSQQQENASLANQIQGQTENLTITVKSVARNFVEKENDVRKLHDEYETILDKISIFEETIRKYKEKLNEKQVEIHEVRKKNEELKSLNLEYVLQIEKLKAELETRDNALKARESSVLSVREKNRVIYESLDKFAHSIDIIAVYKDNLKVFEQLKEENKILMQNYEQTRDENNTLRIKLEQAVIEKENMKPRETTSADRLEVFQELLQKFDALNAKLAQLDTDKHEAIKEKEFWFQRCQDLEEKMTEKDNNDFKRKEIEVPERRRGRPNNAAASVIGNTLKPPEKMVEETSNRYEERGKSKTNEREAGISMLSGEESTSTMNKGRKKGANGKPALTICAICCLIVNRSDKVESCGQCTNLVHVKCASAGGAKPENFLCNICSKSSKDESKA